MNIGNLFHRMLGGSILCDGMYGAVCLAYVTSSIMDMLELLVRFLVIFYRSLRGRLLIFI